MCLYRLGRGDYHYTIAEMVGRRVTTVRNIVHDVSKVLLDKFWEESVSSHMPSSQEEFKQKILDMEELWQLPCCWAAVDDCHIPLNFPPGGLEASKEYSFTILRTSISLC